MYLITMENRHSARLVVHLQHGRHTRVVYTEVHTHGEAYPGSTTVTHTGRHTRVVHTVTHTGRHTGRYTPGYTHREAYPGGKPLHTRRHTRVINLYTQGGITRVVNLIIYTLGYTRVVNLLIYTPGIPG